MANSCVKAAFAIRVAPDEALLIEQVFEAAEQLSQGLDPAEAGALYARFGPAFAHAFPRGAEDAFAAVRALFDDPAYPAFGCEVDIDQPGPDRRVPVWFGGDQVAIDALPRLFHRVAVSSLPIGFQFAFTCDRYRIDEFGGGYAIATAAGAAWEDSRRLLERAFARATGDEPDQLVLASHSAEHGLTFFSAAGGFGPLAEATVFTSTERAALALPCAGDRLEWLTLPAPIDG